LIELIDSNWPEMICSPDSASKRFGVIGSTCDGFSPEQPWYQDLLAASSTGLALPVPKRTKL
jgi:hypothetical protein